MRVAVVDLLTDAPLRSWGSYAYALYFRKQLMSLAPQAVAAWCRRLGHQTYYTTYYGQHDPVHLIPSDIDVLFVASYTQSSALAYALATIFRRRRVLTVIGGAHARSFPTDCTRFFDIVVLNCDERLIADIMNRRFDPPTVVSSGSRPVEFPCVEERMPDIVTASFHRGRPLATSVVPLLASTGCPYNCDFCIDWNSNYAPLPGDQVLADLQYLSRHWPQLIVAYHDPNFAVRFDEVMGIIERLPERRRNRYLMETSLSILKEDRLARLRHTNCAYAAPGIESWGAYSEKAGTGAVFGRKKLERVVARISMLEQHVQGVQANFVFGDEHDQGDEPSALTIEFIKRLPGVWAAINIPTPFGGTPLYDELYRRGRILSGLPFAFYNSPYLAMILRHYDPLRYYQYQIDIHKAITSPDTLFKRVTGQASATVRFVHGLRTLSARAVLKSLRRIFDLLRTDAGFLAFHEGSTSKLPEIYHHLFEKKLGRYAELLPHEARRPVLERPSVT